MDARVSEWRLGAKVVRLPAVMGILNVTPDSFSDGGVYGGVGEAVEAARRMVGEGAAIIDVGGESTRPGAERVGAGEQIARVAPVIEGIRAAGMTVPITVDTTRAEVAEAAIRAGADGVNDVSAGEEDAVMLALAGRMGAGLVLMHRLRPPGGDRYSDGYGADGPRYGDVVAEVKMYLEARARAAEAAGVARESIVVDPGLGFGKTVEQNLELIRRTGEIAALGYPVMSGLSRKSFVGRAVLGRESRPGERVGASVEMSLKHRAAGALIFRVHDVREHVGAMGGVVGWGSHGQAG
ncbi:MAG: dihydropteroate synthase [Phycisphaerales bacterium]|nr:dihydropteroate synthase [Phycisphaerales bacterium]